MCCTEQEPSATGHAFHHLTKAGIVPLTSVSPAPKIDILLPAKERFSPSNAGAISGAVRDLQASRAAKQFRIIGTCKTSLMPEHFTGLLPKMRWLNGHIGLAAAYLDLIHTTVHLILSRCIAVVVIFGTKTPILKYTRLHNDPDK